MSFRHIPSFLVLLCIGIASSAQAVDSIRIVDPTGLGNLRPGEAMEIDGVVIWRRAEAERAQYQDMFDPELNMDDVLRQLRERLEERARLEQEQRLMRARLEQERILNERRLELQRIEFEKNRRLAEEMLKQSLIDEQLSRDPNSLMNRRKDISPLERFPIITPRPR